MRFGDLFEDLDAQWAAEEQAALEAEARDVTRAEVSRQLLVQRLERAQELDVALRAGLRIKGAVTDRGRGWIAILAEDGRDYLVPVAAVAAVFNLGVKASAEEETASTHRATLAGALRAIARDRQATKIVSDAGEYVGTIDRVGQDFVDLAVHPVGESRLAGNVTFTVSVALAALIAVVR